MIHLNMIDMRKTVIMLLLIVSVFFAGCGDTDNIENVGDVEDNSVQTDQSNNQEAPPEENVADDVVDSVINEEEALIDEDIELGELI
jgi:PBP1b-binding outer membrane lipoprotein LpoB